MLEPKKNIQAWLYPPSRVVKTNQSSSRSWGESPQKQGLLGQRLLQQGGAGMIGWSGPWSRTAPVSLEPRGSRLKQRHSWMHGQQRGRCADRHPPNSAGCCLVLGPRTSGEEVCSHLGPHVPALGPQLAEPGLGDVRRSLASSSSCWALRHLDGCVLPPSSWTEGGGGRRLRESLTLALRPPVPDGLWGAGEPGELGPPVP